MGQIPVYYNRYPEGDWQYRDSPVGPLFHFGHGLSYTTFEYSDLQVNATSQTSAEVTVDSANTGNREKELKNFGRITLTPGETKTATFFLNKNAFEFYDEKTEGLDCGTR